MPGLKNHRSGGVNTFEKIQKILAENGAKKVMFDYSDEGEMESISFGIMLNGHLAGFKLPAMVENVVEIMYGGLDRYDKPKVPTDAQRAQAYKTAWANVRDWIDAQMAMVKTRQVDVVQVFLPYMVVKGKDGVDQSMYEKVLRDPQFTLGSGN